VIHQRQRLPLLFEAHDHLFGVHAQLDDLERHAPPHRLELVGHPDGAEASFSKLLEQFVIADPVLAFLRFQACQVCFQFSRIGAID
jgi:hypothetical protein